MPTDKRQRKREGHQARKAAALAEARRRQRKRRLITVVSVAVAVLAVMFLIQFLSSDDDGEDVRADDSTEATTTPTSVPPKAPAAPTEPVTELVIEDIEEGDGPEVKAGDTIVAHYMGLTAHDGKVFENSWETGQLFERPVGVGGLIEGWDEGIPGMKVGGRRKLVIPAEKAYGAEDAGSGRPFGDLVFIIDVYDVK